MTDATDYSRAELMAIVLARHLSDGDVVITGTNSSIPTAAYRVAQRLHAPGIVAISGAAGAVDPTARVIPPSVGDEALRAGRFLIPFPDIVRAEVAGLIDVIFLGAMQVDRRGRCNLVAVGPYQAPRVRGPGTLGLSLMSTVPRALMYLTNHERRTFVESVDFISAEGLRPDGGGIQAIVTPLGVLGPTEGRDALRLHSFHPGVVAEEVQERTGFDIDIARASATPSPTARELAALRAVDTAGFLRGLQL
jgi:glutaconate CoA-transferase subunit B